MRPPKTCEQTVCIVIWRQAFLFRRLGLGCPVGHAMWPGDGGNGLGEGFGISAKNSGSRSLRRSDEGVDVLQ